VVLPNIVLTLFGIVDPILKAPQDAETHLYGDRIGELSVSWVLIKEALVSMDRFQ
jgi:hypothetical protein